MAHGQLHFRMPAPSAVAFESFFNHAVRRRWDTLLDVNYVEGGGDHPYAGAISSNEGRGWKRGLAMRTRFVAYDPPRVAAARMIECVGPFASWAASMRFRDRDDGTCDMWYTYAIRFRPPWLDRWFGWAGGMLFERETRMRFAAMAAYLRANGRERA